MSGELDPSIAAVMNAAGQRVTRQRVAVIEALRVAARPLSVDEIVSASSVAMSTAYRHLSEFCDLGVCSRVSGADRADRFELAERHTDRHHHHLVCVECGAVSDFDPSADLEQSIHSELGGLLDRLDFEPISHVFDVRGRCRTCRRGGANRPAG